MARWSLAQRASLAQTCAAAMFSTFADPSNRGHAWKPSHMPRLIKSHVKTQAFLNAVPKKHHEETIEIALDFYRSFFASAMKRIPSPKKLFKR